MTPTKKKSPTPLSPTHKKTTRTRSGQRSLTERRINASTRSSERRSETHSVGKRLEDLTLRQFELDSKSSEIGEKVDHVEAKDKEELTITDDKTMMELMMHRKQYCRRISMLQS